MRSLFPLFGQISGAVFCVAMICLFAAPAFADSLDGGWCNEDGTKRIHIDGPSIVLPSGRSIQGDYRRHEFSYTVPEGEEGMGDEVRMIQRSHEHMILLPPRSSDGWEDWRRCQAIS